MIGRGALGNPWFIKECVEYVENDNIIDLPTYNERLDMIYKHYNLLKENECEKVALMEIKTHALWYLKYIPNSKSFKNEIVKITKEEDLIEILNKIKNTINENI